MKTYLYILILLCGSILAQAQNYSCINPAVKNYYTNATGFLRSIRIDSVKTIGTDTVLYPYHSFRGEYTMITVLDSNGASWWGKTITIRPDGITQFATQWGDTVFINTQARTGDTWRFFDDTSQYYYTATVTNTIGITGSSDSIKTITINSYSNAGINLADTLNGITLLLSKNNGLVQTIDLGIFPMQKGVRRFDFTTDYLLSESVETSGGSYNFSKANLQYKTTAYSVPDNLEVYDYNIGDMFMYTWISDYQVQYTTQYLYEIIGKQLLTGGVDYYIRQSTKHPNGVINIGAYHKVYNTGALYDTTYLPDEWRSKRFVYFNANDTAYCTKGIYRTKTNFVTPKAQLHMFEPDVLDISYKKGIGVTYDYEQIGAGHTHSRYQLIRLYKGTPCGPKPYMDVATVQADKAVIYPSPANDVVYINTNSSHNTGSIAVINSMGIVVKTIQIEDNTTGIDVQDIPSGIYTLLLTTDTDKYYYKISIVH